MVGLGRLRFRPMLPRTEVLDVQPIPSEMALLRRVMQTVPSRRGAGVVHVGAHVGEEIELYLVSGFRRILLIEANPTVMPRLLQHAYFWTAWISELGKAWKVKIVPEIRVLHAAAADVTGMSSFNISQYSVLSSLLAPSMPEMGAVKIVRVPTFRLDDAVERVGWTPDDIDLIVSDAQGADLSVLKGAPALLQSACMVISEVNSHTRYVGQCQPIQVRAFLEANGFGQSEVVERDPSAWRTTIAFYK